MTKRLMPEDLVLAVLHRVGEDTRIAADPRLVTIFDKAATKHGGMFRRFAKHPQYHDSRTLSDTLQMLDLGGSIVRDNPATKYFRVAPMTWGAYGKTKFAGLTKTQKEVVQEIASEIVHVFKKAGSQPGATGRRARPEVLAGQPPRVVRRSKP